ncbi:MULTISPECIES: DUF2971 domain-containing protein [unclassified Limnohabitans]|jgi:hypothetical protein|uniref:DUF2971 domain-containing protein n=1 Tax=unclassified Limnohabitans TaxID=2626134 RepID=UPI000D3555E1|nr:MULTISPECIES: DUF2971 domain-containing protein [unclassified Limnohabitans]
MYQHRPDLDQPKDEVVLWRYFTLVKFEKLIKDQSIFFCRADKFDDPLEGRTPRGTVREMYRSSPPFVAGAVQMVRDMFRGKTYVSCWREDQEESQAMWSSYAANATGVAVKTTVGRLKSSITAEESFVLARVRYLDFDSHPNVNDIHQQMLIKSLDFQGESEVRLIHLTDVAGGRLDEVMQPKTEPGINLKTNLCDLMEEVVMGANASESDMKSVKRGLVEINCLAKLRMSNLGQSSPTRKG